MDSGEAAVFNLGTALSFNTGMDETSPFLVSGIQVTNTAGTSNTVSVFAGALTAGNATPGRVSGDEIASGFSATRSCGPTIAAAPATGPPGP
jgi:hypothetical protein